MTMSTEDVRVLVTGGAGLIGSHIVEQLLEGKEGLQCREVIVLDDFTRGRQENLAPWSGDDRLKIINGDIRDRAALANAMRGTDLVFHQAAIRITQCAAEPRLALEVLADGTFNVLEEAVKALPETFRARIENVVIRVAELPSKRQSRAPEPKSRREPVLYGLYEGIPRADRSAEDAVRTPDRITIFKKAIERDHRSRPAMVRCIQETVLHELGHYFGLEAGP